MAPEDFPSGPPAHRADGVFSGGGIKGLAFAGALTAAAEAGYTEWVSLAGTSAGAITAMALAVGYSAEDLHKKLDEFDFATIADYGAPFGIGEAENLIVRHALTRGKVLHDWIAQLLEEAPRPAKVFGDLNAELRVVGTDLVHGRMVVFPEDVTRYQDKAGKTLVPEEFPIADAVRISAGYPYFFPPLALIDKQTGKEGALVDGGVCSPFPIFLFDKPEPVHPTWGFRLYGGYEPERPTDHEIHGLGWPIEMLGAILDTSTNALDELEMKQFAERTIAIPTGGVPTLKFDLSDADKKLLYDSGYRVAKDFFSKDPKGINTYGKIPSRAEPARVRAT